MSPRAAVRAELERTLGRSFDNETLLERALTHASVGDGRAPRGAPRDNEQLEFLGDRVLGLLTAEALLNAHPVAREGELALKLNALVNREACADAGRRMGLGAALRLSPSEARAGGREKATILADACEAVIAAIYLDGGLEAARAVYRRFWAPALEAVAARAAAGSKDPKSELQERAQGDGRAAPVYRVVTRSGPDHAPVFTAEVLIEGLEPALGAGASRQAAEKAAAKVLLEREYMT